MGGAKVNIFGSRVEQKFVFSDPAWSKSWYFRPPGGAKVCILQDSASAGGNLILLSISLGAGAFLNEFAVAEDRWKPLYLLGGSSNKTSHYS